MATHTFTVVPDNGSSGTGTAIRDWAQGVHDALAAVGMVQTDDTGQADLSTITNPASTNTSAGYEVWRFDDELQATHPLFVRIEYGRGSSAGAPAMRVSVGRATDGEGNLVNVLVPADRNLAGVGDGFFGSSSNASAGTSYASSGDGSMLAVVLCADLPEGSNGAYPAFVIDRSRDSSGAPTPDGVMFASSQGGSTAALSQFFVAAYNTGANTGGVPPVLVPAFIDGSPISAGNGLGGGVLAPVFPWACFAPGAAPWQALAAVSHTGSDIPGGALSVSCLGAERTFMFFPTMNSGRWGANPISLGNPPKSAIGLGILWE